MHLLSRLAASKIRSNKFHENPRPSLAKNFPISLFLREITRPPFTFYSVRIHALSTFFISRFIRFQFFILLYLSSIFSTLKRNSAFLIELYPFEADVTCLLIVVHQLETQLKFATCSPVLR